MRFPPSAGGPRGGQTAPVSRARAVQGGGAEGGGGSGGPWSEEAPLGSRGPGGSGEVAAKRAQRATRASRVVPEGVAGVGARGHLQTRPPHLPLPPRRSGRPSVPESSREAPGARGPSRPRGPDGSRRPETGGAHPRARARGAATARLACGPGPSVPRRRSVREAPAGVRGEPGAADAPSPRRRSKRSGGRWCVFLEPARRRRRGGRPR